MRIAYSLPLPIPYPFPYPYPCPCPCPTTVSVTEGRTRSRNSHQPRGHFAPTGRAGFDIVPHRSSGKAQPPAQCHTGHSTGKPLFPSCPGSVAGRRRAIGVVAALTINPRTTTPMVRRWAARPRRPVPIHNPILRAGRPHHNARRWVARGGPDGPRLIEAVAVSVVIAATPPIPQPTPRCYTPAPRLREVVLCGETRRC